MKQSIGVVPHPMDIAFGQRLRQCREDRKISQADLGRECNVSFQQIQKYEKGTNRVSFSRITEFAACLGMTVIELIEPLVGPRGLHDVNDTLQMLQDNKTLSVARRFAALDALKRKFILTALDIVS